MSDDTAAGHEARGKATTPRAEQAERAEMFGFHPAILAEAGEPPRRIGGHDRAAQEPPAPARSSGRATPPAQT